MQSIICISNTQPMHTTSMHLGTRSYYGTRVRGLGVMHDKITSTMQQGIGTNHKSLQVHENNPKTLQKQHWYKTQKLHKHGYKHKVQTKLNNILSLNKPKFHTQTYP